MTMAEKRDIVDTINILKQLDQESLLIIDSGARMLKARMDMEKLQEEKKGGE